MAKQKPPSLSADAAIELYEIRNIVGMATFAAEARRVLREILLMTDGVPEFNATLSRLVDNHGQWLEYPDCSAAVLNDVHKRLNVLLDDE